MLSRRLLRRAAALKSAALDRAAAPASAMLHSSASASAAPSAGGAAVPSFARGLFAGRIESSFVHPYPDVLATEERETLRSLVEPVAKFFETENDAAKNDENAQVDPKVVEALKPMGAFGLQVPEEHGGVGLTNTGYARMVEIVGGNDLGLGIFLGAHQSIGFKGILLFGTEAQKAKYLPKLASGENVAAFCLTEPSSGSDANSIRTRAELSADGKHFVLNGGKIWISNGGIAEIFTVFAKTKMPDGKDKVTAFIVERSFGGVTNGPPENKMGIKCSNTAEVYFDNVPIPVENVLGEVGGGFKVAMEILNNGRFGMGAALTGTMKTVIKGAAAHAVQRKQFDHHLRDFELIKGKFSHMAMKAYAAESLAYLVAANMDRGAKDYQLEAAVSKIFASEAAWFVADEAIQVMGGLGFMKAYPYERIQRDLRIFRIFEGTNDILRLFVALTGLQTLGKELEPIQKAAKAPLANLGTLAPYAVTLAKNRLGFPDRPSLAWASPKLRPAAEAIEAATAAFGATSQELLMKYGKGILEKQLHLERVADCVIDITAATAVTARATRSVERNLTTADHEVLLANAFALEAARRVKDNVAKLNGAVSGVDKMRNQIADQIFDHGGIIATPPLGF